MDASGCPGLAGPAVDELSLLVGPGCVHGNLSRLSPHPALRSICRPDRPSPVTHLHTSYSRFSGTEFGDTGGNGSRESVDGTGFLVCYWMLYGARESVLSGDDLRSCRS